ncbi:hypothetical protein HAX54_047947 [Datura stramonium]|uniref:Uncharacterized protein n=1 Tax=Datura stramonium TaxID=4076 RepID=A0ABS8STT1_DATST|nr:hypothetical protein [Datura stramonium]
MSERRKQEDSTERKRRAKQNEKQIDFIAQQLKLFVEKSFVDTVSLIHKARTIPLFDDPATIVLEEPHDKRLLFKLFEDSPPQDVEKRPREGIDDKGTIKKVRKRIPKSPLEASQVHTYLLDDFALRRKLDLLALAPAFCRCGLAAQVQHKSKAVFSNFFLRGTWGPRVPTCGAQKVLVPDLHKHQQFGMVEALPLQEHHYENLIPSRDLSPLSA